MGVPAECRSDPGEFVPVVDRAKCEGKADCVEVCPFHVFEVRRIDEADFARLGVFGKLKSMAHGRKTCPGEKVVCHAICRP
jgi:4Fe-4S ferredoxin